MNELGIVGLVVLLATVFVSYKGFQEPAYFERYAFAVDAIRHRREYERLLTSGFLHTGWLHLAFNLLTLWCFGGVLEALVGVQHFLLLYFGSLLGGNLLSLWLHRHEPAYRAVGASGAISGLVLASIAQFPGLEVGMLGFYLPGWLYGLLYVVVSAYGIKARHGNIGHDAHLGGGLVGLLTMVALHPQLLRLNPLPIAAMLLPAVAFGYWLVMKPHAFRQDRFSPPADSYTSTDDRYYAHHRQQEADLDGLLDKISHSGLDSLTPHEKQELKRLSR
ncbi:rhomboid family intramembrane serine protease [Hymenobacter weizhouensis]|uniref:rhomboid family intramembrane serine protease n=1 Tax=Hymenobacter sp. YIM 151500-1 TaxID=2987689 RepID=UPI002227DB64|nr:rhomboid family intramembrane serine protease [Hymenobacter sp. YIM 151500-1]UYZ64205.1 rhomboid family intramembrane serine protease [Hymenobacter sp. YIM 151500-1]